MHGSRYFRLALLGATLLSTPLLAATPDANQANTPPAAGTTNNTATTTPAPAANATNNTATTTPAPAANANNNAAATTPAPANNMATTMTPANNHNAGATNVPVNNTTANNKGPDGTLHKYDNAWRGSKLVGANVYNEQGQTVASIDDLLVSDDGKIDRAVLSTGGGILGVGAKLVTVPFSQLKFEPSANNNNAVAANGNTNAHPNTAVLPRAEAPAGNGNPNGNAGTTANAQTAPTTVVASNNNNAANNNNNPEDFSIVLPGATKDSLKNEQEFKFAAD